VRSEREFRDDDSLATMMKDCRAMIGELLDDEISDAAS
jgi:hypothetical protein